MKTLLSFLQRNLHFSNFWVRNILILILVSILVNHLGDPKNFPLNESYSFPWFPVTASIFLGSIVLVIANFNFNYYKKTYFIEEINLRILLRYLFSTLGYISIAYALFYFTLNGWINGIESYNFYHFLTGLSVSLLICSIGITILFAHDVYKLHKFTSIKGKLKVEHAGKISLIGYDEIAFFYSENKVVYLVKTDGTTTSTDFTLNEIENKINIHSFFRANRQIILHSRSVEQVQLIENGKLTVQLKPTISDKEAFQINISRYKKQAFMNWFENKL
ncbi:LytR/AlgR family response regulator transcription factor [Pseudotenacibaculum haliotis]|uniref:LytR/AlgR family response regulator transcription factor n=1 Tax=Pseudotenacibaculum haliotis TaxID=1862138 RepID=A0ABW5LTV0_9FLAO